MGIKKHIDNIIKLSVIEEIDRIIENYQPTPVKNVLKTMPLNKYDLDGVVEGFKSAYNADGYVAGSACVDYYQDEGDWGGDVHIAYSVTEPTSEKDREQVLIKRINKNLAFSRVYKKLTSLGYKRVPVNGRDFREFKASNIYDMYINDRDKLTRYFQLFFVKQD